MIIKPNDGIIVPGIEVKDDILYDGHILVVRHLKSNGYRPEIIGVSKSRSKIRGINNTTYPAVFLDCVMSDKAMDNLSPNYTLENGDDGIFIYYSENPFAVFKSSGSAALSGYTLGWNDAGATISLTGEFTGTACEIASIKLGHNFGTGSVEKIFAVPSSWTNVVLPTIYDYCYVVWTITGADT